MLRWVQLDRAAPAFRPRREVEAAGHRFLRGRRVDGADWHDLAAGGGLGAIAGPGLREPTALLEYVAAPLGGFDLIVDNMGERHFNDVVLEIRALGRPIPESRPKAMHGDVVAP